VYFQPDYRLVLGQYFGSESRRFWSGFHHLRENYSSICGEGRLKRAREKPQVQTSDLSYRVLMLDSIAKLST
jgi:hypothetical protein